MSFLFLLTLFFSCGKNIDDSKADSPISSRDERDGRANGDFFTKQKTICADEYNCPENIAKIIVTDKSGSFTRYCTGFLFESDKVMFSSSCLEPAQRVPRLECSKSIYVVFADSILGKKTFYGCSRILYSDNNRGVQEPSFWQGDLAIIELDSQSDRTPLQVSKSGFTDAGNVDLWTVNTLDEYTGQLTKNSCQTYLNTWLNPFSENSSSPMGVVSSCDLSREAMGAPILSDGRAIGLYSQKMSEKVSTYLKKSGIMGQELTHYHHTSNLACLKFKNVYQTSSIPSECSVETSYAKLDRKRKDFLESTSVHRSKIAKILKETTAHLQQVDPEIFWSPEFIKKQSENEYELSLGRPTCLNNSQSWIHKYSYVKWRRVRYYTSYYRDLALPNYRLTAKLSSNLQPMSAVKEEGVKQVRVTFRPYDVRFSGVTSVDVVDTLFGASTHSHFENISNDCLR